MNRTTAQAAHVAAVIVRAKREILQDVIAGRVPADVAGFGDLHNHVDANEYGGMCEDSTRTELRGLDLMAALFPDPSGSPDYGTINSQAGMDVCAEIQDALHAWIVAGGLRAALAAA